MRRRRRWRRKRRWRKRRKGKKRRREGKYELIILSYSGNLREERD